MCPRSPTATRRLPAWTTSIIRTLAALGDSIANTGCALVSPAANTGVDNTPNSESAVASIATLRAARGQQTAQPMTGSLIDLSPHLLLLGGLAFPGSETCTLERLEEAGPSYRAFESSDNRRYVIFC